nr:probable LRR receptor-like serine/threonine-protein kinase At1g56130 isoform X1 [Setaria viridis]
MRRRYSSSSSSGVLAWLLLVCSCFEKPLVQAQQAARTDPIEAAALNTILGRWGQKAMPSPAWNISGEPCSGAAVDGTGLDGNNDFNPGITCACSFGVNSSVCHITMLKVYALNVVGQIPSELQNLTYLTYLCFWCCFRNLDLNYLTGPIPSFIGHFSAMQHLSLGFNPLSGPLPKELGNLTNVNLLGISLDNFTGGLPEELGNLSKLEQLYIDSSGFSGPFPSTFSKLKKLRILRASDNDFTGKIPYYFGSLTNLEDLVLYGNSFEGPIPASLSNLTRLTNLIIGDIVNGSSSLAFISNLTSLSTLILRNCKLSGNLGAVNISKLANLILLDLSFNNITGQVPRSILTLDKLEFLILGNNSLSGSLPDVKSASLKNLDFSYNLLTGKFPSWATERYLHLNLVANNFVLDSTDDSILPSGLNCLQQDTPCFLGSPQYYSFAVDCGGNRSMVGSDSTMYDLDPTDLGASSYYVSGQTRWGVSNVGKFNQAPNGSNIIYSSNQQFQNTADSELFQTARMSASSLRYYGLGLENGNYTVVLQFAETAYPDTQTWQSLGRRVFDIYVQGSLREKNFNIRKTAGGKSFAAVSKSYTATVSKNFLEIHLFWAGKGTCCIPKQGYYGPMISALSVTPNFTPTVRNGVPKKKSKAGAIAGIVIGASVLGLVALFGILMFTKRRRRLARQQQELYDLIGQPDVFSYAELKLATDNFSPQNILGEGGYGPVYKGTLTDGRVIAVKQLSQSSHQGKRQFVAEVATISAVQHRNLVKLHGCCIDSNTHLLVYEYLENGSLDRALFGDSSMKLDWSTRFEIILGIARGLTYLHEESSIRIVHRDIKASNVLLDTDLTPKVSDFGLAKLYEENKSHVSTSRIAGTFGYLAPEYAMRGQLTEKADVFAFGVVVLEVVSGRSNTDNSLEERNVYLLERAWGLYEGNQPLQILDPRLEEFYAEEVLRVIRVALICTQGSPHQRPAMSRVVAMLTGKAEVAEEVAKPSYVITESQLRDGDGGCTTSSYWASTSTPEFSRQKEVDPLTRSPTITGASHEIEGR